MSPSIARCDYVFRRILFKNGTIEEHRCLYDVAGAVASGHFYCSDHLTAFVRWAAGDVSALSPVEEDWR